MKRLREEVALLVAPWLYEGHERAARWAQYATKWVRERDRYEKALREIVEDVMSTPSNLQRQALAARCAQRAQDALNHREAFASGRQEPRGGRSER